MNKLIMGIQTIKHYVWEKPTLQKIEKVRGLECSKLLTLLFWKGFSEGTTRNSSALLALPIVLLPLA